MWSTFLNRIAEQLGSELPFVVYRKPNTAIVKAILQKDDHIHHTTDFSEKGFVFAPFDTDGKAILIPVEETYECEAIVHESPIEGRDTAVDDSKAMHFHMNLVEKALEQLRSGQLQKVVLSRNIKVPNSQSPLDLFQKLIGKYSNAFCYLWYHPKVGMWLGATPEILLRTDNKRLITMSLAGTQPYNDNGNLSWGVKELTEQQMVTDYIANVLKNEITNMHIADLESIRAGQLMHLRTKITGLFDTNLAKIIRALHPTPAVCGMPLPAAKQFIGDNENYQREYYTGFLGELNFKTKIERSRSNRNQENKSYRTIKTTSELFVNLRCMQLVTDAVLIYVGGGITKESDPKEEWKETIAKSRTMSNILG